MFFNAILIKVYYNMWTIERLTILILNMDLHFKFIQLRQNCDYDSPNSPLIYAFTLIIYINIVVPLPFQNNLSE